MSTVQLTIKNDWNGAYSNGQVMSGFISMCWKWKMDMDIRPVVVAEITNAERMVTYKADLVC
ncbi:MAG: hypothetical protein R2788_03490 [Saprospiraceae bacterium]